MPPATVSAWYRAGGRGPDPTVGLAPRLSGAIIARGRVLIYPAKLVLLVVLAPLWLPHYLALLGVGLLIRRSLVWPATPTRNSNARADTASVTLVIGDQSERVNVIEWQRPRSA